MLGVDAVSNIYARRRERSSLSVAHQGQDVGQAQTMLRKAGSSCKGGGRKIHCYWPEIVCYVMNKWLVILLCGGLLCCGMFLMPHLDFGRAVHKEPQSVHDVEAAVKSLTLASKRYDATNVVDVFGDIYYRANKRLSENGLYGIGLHLVDTNTDVDTSSVTIDVPELTIFQAFEFVARRFGWAVEYNGGGVFVRGRHSEHLPEWRE